MSSEDVTLKETEVKEPLFNCDLILHFGYHKCLTVLYSRLMQDLSTEFDFRWVPVYSNCFKFRQAARDSGGQRVLLSTDSDNFDLNELPEYRGSHFIRDPRDLVVSGYFYHLWTTEAWCQSPGFNWKPLTGHPVFEYIEPDKSNWPSAVSYQEYLNTLDQERGMLLEMVFGENRFQQMSRWDFNNPLIMEMRYEEVVGNEESTFSRLFDHYGFHPKLCKRGMKVAEKLALKNQVKQEGTHVRSGKSGQWIEHFTPATKQIFKQTHGDLIVRLGYETDSDW